MREIARDFHAFRQHVFGDAALLQRLSAITPLDALIGSAAHEGAALGYPFSATDVLAEVQRVRRDWIEQWIAPQPVEPDQHQSADTDHESRADFTGWLPIRLFIRHDSLWVDWCYAGTRRLREPFFTGDVQSLLSQPFNLAFRRYTPIGALVTWAEQLREHGTYAPLKAVIAHVSRCGSTLVTQMLAQLPTHRVLSEPPMLDVLLNIRHQWPQVTREQQVAWLRALVVVLGHGGSAATTLVMKLDAWHILELDLLKEAFPNASFILLFRDPLAVAASHMQQPTSYMIPAASNSMPWTPPHDAAIWNSSERYLAAVLGKIYETGAAACERGAARAIDYRSLPDAVYEGLADTFALPQEATAMAALKQRAAQHAKRRDESFDAAADAARNQAVSEILRDAISASCAASYARLIAAASIRPNG